MGEPWVLTFDVGTQSARHCWWTGAGAIADLCQENTKKPYYSKSRLGGASRTLLRLSLPHGKGLCCRNGNRIKDVIVTLTTIRTRPVPDKK